MDDKNESFVRWQSITRDYFSSLSSLVLGLSSGLLAFLSSGFPYQPTTDKFTHFGLAIAAAFLATSIVIAVLCAINRLRDFRATAKIARLRCNGDPVSPESRNETRILGKRSWHLLCWQLVLFGLGALALAAATISRICFS